MVFLSDTIFQSACQCMIIPILICENTNKPQMYGEHLKLCALGPTPVLSKYWLESSVSRCYFRCGLLCIELRNGVERFLSPWHCVCTNLKILQTHRQSLKKFWCKSIDKFSLFSNNIIPSLSYEREAKRVGNGRNHLMAFKLNNIVEINLYTPEAWRRLLHRRIFSLHDPHPHSLSPFSSSHHHRHLTFAPSPPDKTIIFDTVCIYINWFKFVICKLELCAPCESVEYNAYIMHSGCVQRDPSKWHNVISKNFQHPECQLAELPTRRCAHS